MDRQLKQRVVGAALLVAFGVIFIPIFLDDGAGVAPLPDTVDIPPAPDVKVRVEPLSQAAIDELESRAGEDVELPLRRIAPRGDADAMPDPADIVIDPLDTPARDPAPVPDPMLRPVPPPAAAPPVEKAPAPAAAAPVPESAAAGPAPAGHWTVQLGSFSRDANAQRLVEKLRAQGFAAQVERHVESGAAVFKVRVGREAERAGAERLRARLEQEFAVKGMLVQYP